jgi:hypothetical protein
VTEKVPLREPVREHSRSRFNPTNALIASFSVCVVFAVLHYFDLLNLLRTRFNIEIPFIDWKVIPLRQILSLFYIAALPEFYSRLIIVFVLFLTLS